MKAHLVHALLQFLAKFWFTPKNLRLSLQRKILNLKNNSINDFTFKIVESEIEVVAALEFLKRTETHRSQFDYLSKWKINKFLTLPSCTLVIALHKKKMIGVGGLLIDNPLGLPCEASSEVAHLRENGHRIGELLGLSLLKNEYLNSEALGLAINQYLCHFAKNNLKIDYVIAPIPDSLEDYFEGVLCYTKNSFEDDRIIYSDDNTPLTPVFLDLNSELLTHLTPEQRDDFAALATRFQMPKSEFYVGTYSSKTMQYMQKLYNEKSALLEGLTINDKLTLDKIYNMKSFRNLIPLSNSLASKRHHVRYPSACPAMIHDHHEDMEALAIDVSHKGLSVMTHSPLVKKYKMAQSIKLTVHLAPNRQVTLEGEVIWKSSSKSAIGISLNKTLPSEWLSFIDYLEAEFSTDEYKKVG